MSHLQLLFLLLIFIASNLDPTVADPPYRICISTTNFNATTPFQSNLDNLISSFVSNSSVSLESNSSSGIGRDTVYGQYMCLKYVNLTDDTCSRCIQIAGQAITRLCANVSDAIIWQETCQLHYSSQKFFGQLNVSGNIPLYNNQSVENPDDFWPIVNSTLKDLAEAVYDGNPDMYAVRSSPFRDGDSVYALAQCTTDLSPNECRRCLQVAIDDISLYNYTRGARLLSRSCYLRYEMYAFYEGESGTPDPGEENSKRKGNYRRVVIVVIVAVAVGLLVAILLGTLLFFGCKKRRHNINRKENRELENQNAHQRDELSNQQSALMDFASIQIATDFFSRSNFLGEGGFGPVYKGILRDGKEVAVKRLSNGSEQGTIKFMNEVTLIMKLQHKNLVKLLGCCVDGEEKLLVYEFMPNNSLDAILFNPEKRSQLDWSRRVNIINGIARGLLYLHEDSRLIIIHRDLKPGNVLLDNDMNPKISDFGTARNFASNDGEHSTVRVAGTYGYMAPEYAMDGTYSIKTDVFSFGVMLLEIITGNKNAGFHKTKRASSLLLYAWQLMKEQNQRELVDPLLANSCDLEEFSRYMQIGLLCVQEAATDRPTMLTVVQMMRSESVVALPQPERPNALPMGTFIENSDDAIAGDFSVNGLTNSSVLPR